MILIDKHIKRTLPTREAAYDIIVVGGGLAGTCCAITAAREGIRVALVQDRPVLGGNASSEVRIWALGATSHMGNNNRWSREGGVIDEILLENQYRNKEGNPVLFDMILMDKVLAERNITLYLNTCVYDVVMEDERMISKVLAYSSLNQLLYSFSATYFADCSGDGIISYLAGASYRFGTEEKTMTKEGLAPEKLVKESLLGDSILFYTRDTGHDVDFVVPDFALKPDQIEMLIPKLNNPRYFNSKQYGCKFWWLEYGGHLDTVHDTEQIKYELWRIVYGLWNYIKNSGRYPEMSTYTLEWVGTIPGKRESRRFMGYYTLSQDDIIEQTHFEDAVAYGGWAIDLHPVNPVYNNEEGCHQYHSKGIYEIPYRCYISCDIDNLFLGGRLISVTQIAHGSTRVICTAALSGQVAGMATSLCKKYDEMPKDLYLNKRIEELQQRLVEAGHFIPNTKLPQSELSITASSTFSLRELPFNGQWRKLKNSAAQLLFATENFPSVRVPVRCGKDTTLRIEIRTAKKAGNYTPELLLSRYELPVGKGEHRVEIPCEQRLQESSFVFICFMANSSIELGMSDMYLPGLTTVYNDINPSVSNYGKQAPPTGIGVESFEFWCPKRRPDNNNFALEFSTALEIYSVKELQNTYYRPYMNTNCWVADLRDCNPKLLIRMPKETDIKSVRIFFDCDYDQALEPIQMGHCDRVSPLCVREYRIKDSSGRILYHVRDNHLSYNKIPLNAERVSEIIVELVHPSENIPASVYGIIVEEP